MIDVLRGMLGKLEESVRKLETLRDRLPAPATAALDEVEHVSSALHELIVLLIDEREDALAQAREQLAVAEALMGEGDEATAAQGALATVTPIRPL